MSVIYKSRATIRVEGDRALELFLLTGGSVQLIRPRRAPVSVMSGKTTKTSSLGTSGCPVGYPNRACV